MWPAGFDPARLNRDASLNKLTIGRAPGVHPSHVGKNGGDLLGRDAIVRLVQQRCGIDVRKDAVADCLLSAMSADSSAGDAARVVKEIGDRLASLIATLRHPGTAAAATGARRIYLEVWRSLDLVMLGGGLVRGAIGERVAAQATAALAAEGVDAPVLRVAQHQEWLALIGASRSASPDDAWVAVMDGGQTSIKRGIARIQNQELVGVRVLPPVPVDSTSASRLAAAVGVALTSLARHGVEAVAEVIFSVASYVQDGRPIRDNSSIYERVEPDRMESRAGVPIRLVHDGSAAWRGTNAEAPSAVIVLGTWLGVGMGPHHERLRACSAAFTVESDGAGARPPM